MYTGTPPAAPPRILHRVLMSKRIGAVCRILKHLEVCESAPIRLKCSSADAVSRDFRARHRDLEAREACCSEPRQQTRWSRAANSSAASFERGLHTRLENAS